MKHSGCTHCVQNIHLIAFWGMNEFEPISEPFALQKGKLITAGHYNYGSPLISGSFLLVSQITVSIKAAIGWEINII